MAEAMLFSLYHMVQMLALGFELVSGETFLQEKTSLVISGTQTQVLADSMTIAASVLNHCTT